MSQPRIHCPHCSWQPTADARWCCTQPGCGTVWHTFWTRGLCPGCGYQWRNTACLACEEMSPHLAWYHWPDDQAQTRDAERSIEVAA